ncbi:MAG: prolipoprotein diacylglyceryl transferase [Deltaproteobacteria bacterium]|nr:prolipoprotein diacylglyceryl transferase [Deltaproteobacteria bacterium]
MWPYVIEQPLRIGTYGVMMAVGFLTAMWILSREHRRRNIDPKHAETTIFLAIIFGVLGSKLTYMITEAETWSWGDLVSGAGLTWHGGLILATVAIVTYYKIKKLPVAVMFDALSPTLATGYAFGRVGCQLSGDGDYGLACGDFVNRAQCWMVDLYERGFEICWSKIPPLFCMSYPDGIVPTDELVHPTPVYESTMNFGLFGILWMVRKRIRWPGVLFGLYMMGSGVMRFYIEQYRGDEGRPDRFLELRDAEIIGLLQLAFGIGLAIWSATRKVPKDLEYGVLPVPSPEPAKKKKKK